MPDIFDKINSGAGLSFPDIVEILSIEDEAGMKRLFDAAYKVKLEHIGNKVSFRGLIEISNICTKNCYYCGIRRDNRKTVRYQMTTQEILSAAKWAYEAGYGSIVLQGGERSDSRFTESIEEIVRAIKKLSGHTLGITLSLGEQTAETYKRWFDAGAHRYLLRIETSSQELYRKLHPADHSFDARRKCLEILRDTGYQTGSGVMIGFPGQTVADLAGDLMFFKDMDLDMIGMGPYIVHHDTPLAEEFPDFESKREYQLNLALKMIAGARLLMKDINIASTTALQALRDDGRELGLLAGANVIMPNITDVTYRNSYQLYEGKPGLNDGPLQSLTSLKAKIESIGETIAFNEWGDSPHFYGRQRKK